MRSHSFMLIIVGAMLVCASCSHQNESNHPRHEITQAMKQQEEAWNRGDIDAFMNYYWDDDSLLFIGLHGPTYGWETTLENYKKSYNTPEKMGKLQFQNHRIDSLGPDAANVFGEWKLERSTDTIGGYYTLLWKRMNNQWRITQDHTN